MKWIFGVFIIFCWTQFVYTKCCPRTTILFDTDDNCIAFNAEEVGALCEIEVCNDGEYREGVHCGTQSCNMLGCDCDGSCFGGNGDATENFKARHGSRVRHVLDPRHNAFAG